MPWSSEWIPPEIFFEHGGVSVYHTYKNDDLDYGPSGVWFTLDEYGCNESGVMDDSFHLDIRDLDKEVFPDDPLLEGHPPFLNKSNFPDESAAAYDEAKQSWVQWRAGENCLKKRILREAIDRGLLRSPSAEKESA